MLRQMQAERFHIAIVIDGRRRRGLVTLEDILEEVVNELTDEHDRPLIEPGKSEAGRVARSRALPDPSWASSSAARSKTRTSTPSVACSPKRAGSCPARQEPSPAS